MRSTGSRKTDGSRRSRLRVGVWVIVSVATAVVQILGADLAIPLVALLDQTIDIDRLEGAQMAPHRRAGGVGRHAVVVLGAARRRRPAPLRRAEPFQIRRRQLEGVGGFDLAGNVAPEDGGA